MPVLLHVAGSGAAPDGALSTEPAARLFRFLFSVVPQWVQLSGILIGVPVGLIVAWLLWKNRLAVLAWFRARSRGFQIALVSAFAIVSLSGTGTGLVGYHYMMHNNDFCQSCHIMDTAWNRFQVSAHKSLTCHECHRQPIWVSSIELYWWVTERRMAVPAHDKVPTKVGAYRAHGVAVLAAIQENLSSLGYQIFFPNCFKLTLISCLIDEFDSGQRAAHRPHFRAFQSGRRPDPRDRGLPRGFPYQRPPPAGAARAGIHPATVNRFRQPSPALLQPVLAS